MKNNIIRGVRKASDFLMALQLTGAFKEEALANLQVELPAVVIGGGLTAIDTATELLAYYPLQAEKTLERYETLVRRERARRRSGRSSTTRSGRSSTACSRHGRAVRQERERARAAGETPDLARLCRAWGGVSIVYRRAMEESPAYRLNHEEVIKALEEGISFIEGLEPVEAVPDELRQARGHAVPRGRRGETVELPGPDLPGGGRNDARTSRTRRSSRTPFRWTSKRRFFAPHRAVRGGRWASRLEPAPADDESAFFTGYSRGGQVRHLLRRQPPRLQRQRRQGHGLGEARLPRDRRGARRRTRRRASAPDAEWDAFRARIADDLSGRGRRGQPPDADDRRGRRPGAGRRRATSSPGQFFRLQNLESRAPARRAARRS